MVTLQLLLETREKKGMETRSIEEFSSYQRSCSETREKEGMETGEERACFSKTSDFRLGMSLWFEGTHGGIRIFV